MHAKFYYKTNDGHQFSISESGWHIVNETNSMSGNDALSTLTADKLIKLLEFTSFNPRYNYLIHPTTIEETGGDHVLITVAKPDSIITEENLEISKSELLEEWSRSKGHVEKVELDLVKRPKLSDLPDSAYARLQLKDLTEEYFSIQSQEQCVVVSFSSSPKNIDHYRRIMFEIVDSIEVQI